MLHAKELLIYVGHSPRDRWFWRACVDRRTLAKGANYRTRREALMQLVVWLLKAGLNPRLTAAATAPQSANTAPDVHQGP